VILLLASRFSPTTFTNLFIPFIQPIVWFPPHRLWERSLVLKTASHQWGKEGVRQKGMNR
jgi:hypothetical protein